MNVIVFTDGPLEHNHMRLGSAPQEVRVQWHPRQVAVYRCMHHETPTGNVKYTCTDKLHRVQRKLIKVP
jgi:hypothetical protein